MLCARVVRERVLRAKFTTWGEERAISLPIASGVWYGDYRAMGRRREAVNVLHRGALWSREPGRIALVYG